MPQHSARHHAPTYQLHALANLQTKGEIAGDAHRLADLHVGVCPRMRVAKLEHHGLAPIAPPDTLRGSARHDTSTESFGLSLSQAGERTPGR